MFMGLASLLIISLALTTSSNLIYQVINLSFLSLVVIAMWITSVGNNIVFMAYILAFVGAVVMLFLSVVMMLPSSVISVQPQVNMVFLLPWALIAKILSLAFTNVSGVANVLLWAWCWEFVLSATALIILMHLMHKDITGKNMFDALPFFYKHYLSNKSQAFPVNVFTFGKYIIGAYNPMLLTKNLSELEVEDQHQHGNTRSVTVPHKNYITINNYIQFSNEHGFRAAPELAWLLHYEGFITSLAYRMRPLVNRTILSFWLCRPIEKNPFIDKFDDYLQGPGSAHPEYYVPIHLLQQTTQNPLSSRLFQMEGVSGYDLNPALSSCYQRQMLNLGSLVFILFATYTILSYGAKLALLSYSPTQFLVNRPHLLEILTQTTLTTSIFLSALNLIDTNKSSLTNLVHAIANSLAGSNDEGALGIKNTLYETNPTLIIVSVVVLLVALLGAALLSRKSK